jgi:hypothetical protein
MMEWPIIGKGFNYPSKYLSYEVVAKLCVTRLRQSGCSTHTNYVVVLMLLFCIQHTLPSIYTDVHDSIASPETSHMDIQNVLKAIEQLLSLNGWVGALCPTLVRPFGQNKKEETYDDLASDNHLYYIAIVVHSADHFLVDQLAVIVQLAKRLGSANLFVSMLDYASTDSTETLTDLCEAVLTLLSVPFRIRRVPPMTEDPLAAYYPLEEAHTRNLALEPLHEFYDRRNIKFHRVIWLKGFTCPNDILETIKVSVRNEAAMVCGMDWAEHNGFFIFSDRFVFSIFFSFRISKFTFS